jgi:hypothetical protein
VNRLALGTLAEEQVASVGHHRPEDHRHADHRYGRRPPEADLHLGTQHVQLTHEQAERGQPEQRDEPEAEYPPERRAPGEQCLHLGNLAGAFGGEDLSGGEEQDPLGETMTDDVQEHGRDRQRGAGGRAQGDEAHVLDAVIGEHPLVVALGEQQGGGHDERQEPHGHEQCPWKRRTEGAVGDRLEP